MKSISFKKYLTSLIGEAPETMVNPHAHHILFKTGNGEAQQALVEEGQAILRRYGIDPIIGKENLTWAPNAVVGQHDEIALKEVLNALRTADEYYGTYDSIVKALKKSGDIASRR